MIQHDCVCRDCRRHFEEYDGDFIDERFVCFNCQAISGETSEEIDQDEMDG